MRRPKETSYAVRRRFPACANSVPVSVGVNAHLIAATVVYVQSPNKPKASVVLFYFFVELLHLLLNAARYLKNVGHLRHPVACSNVAQNCLSVNQDASASSMSFTSHSVR